MAQFWKDDDGIDAPAASWRHGSRVAGVMAGLLYFGVAGGCDDADDGTGTGVLAMESTGAANETVEDTMDMADTAPGTGTQTAGEATGPADTSTSADTTGAESSTAAGESSTTVDATDSSAEGTAESSDESTDSGEEMGETTGDMSDESAEEDGSGEDLGDSEDDGGDDEDPCASLDLPDDPPQTCSEPEGEPVILTVVNRCAGERVSVVRLDEECNEAPVRTIKPGDVHNLETHAGVVYRLRSQSGDRLLKEVGAAASDRTVVVP